MSFYKKYLKYKNKYLELKNQLGGLSFNIITTDFEKFRISDKQLESSMFETIPEFRDNTKEPYKNNDERKVNFLKITQNGINFIKTIKEKAEILNALDDDLKKIIQSDDWSKKISYLEGFYNIDLSYTENIKEGTIVNSSKIKDVFTDEFIKNIKDDENYNSVKGKNFGIYNLFCALTKLKIKKPELIYIYLHASGKEDLIKYYKDIGFNIQLNIPFMMLNDDGSLNEDLGSLGTINNLMFGKYDVIIKCLKEKLEKHFNSINCVKKY
jgi:hypothetical protein